MKADKIIKKLKIAFSVVIILFLAGCVSSQTFDKKEAANARLGLAMAYFNEGNLPAAYANFVKAMEYDHKNYQTQLGMALYEQSIGEMKSAEKRYLSLLKHEKDPVIKAIISSYYGVFLCSTDQYDKAQKYFAVAIKSDDLPTRTMALQNAGFCAYQKGEQTQATRFFNELQQLLN